MDTSDAPFTPDPKDPNRLFQARFPRLDSYVITTRDHEDPNEFHIVVLREGAPVKKATTRSPAIVTLRTIQFVAEIGGEYELENNTLAIIPPQSILVINPLPPEIAHNRKQHEIPETDEGREAYNDLLKAIGRNPVEIFQQVEPTEIEGIQPPEGWLVFESPKRRAFVKPLADGSMPPTIEWKEGTNCSFYDL